MKVITLRIKDSNGEKVLNNFDVLAGVGIKGDEKANGGDRQLCISDEDSLNEYRNSKKGVCVHRFMPNITTTGLDYSNLKDGDKFRIGDTIIEISSTFKKCFPECEFVQSGTVCQIKNCCAFARILEGGKISAGDEIIEI